MRRPFFIQFIVFLMVACQSSQTAPTVSTSQVVFENSNTLMPTSTITAVPINIDTPTFTPVPSKTPTVMPSPIPSSTPPPNPFELDITGKLITYPLPIIRQDDTAVYIQESRLIVADVAEPSLPIAIWESEFLGNVIDATADKNYLHVWVDNGVHIWDIIDLQEPTQIARLPFEMVQEGFRKEIIVDTDKLYLVQIIRKDALLTVVDIGLPESPKIWGTSEFYFPAYHQFLFSNEFLFGVGDGQVDVYDISDPHQANLIKQIIVPTNIGSSLSLQGDLLFVATHSKLIVLDISNLSTPTQLSESVNMQINELTILNQTGFLFSEICGFEPKEDGTVSGGCGYLMDVVDISNPSDLTSKGFARLHFGRNQGFVEQIQLLDAFFYFKLSDSTAYVVAVNQFGE